MAEFTIVLKDLWFFSFHGLHEEEKKTGGEFVVDLHAKFAEQRQIISIHQTVDYSELYSVVKQEMAQPKELLETLALSIVEKAHRSFPAIKEIEISIEKKNPPIANFSGSVAVRLKKQF